jgi:hypothetical protein
MTITDFIKKIVLLTLLLGFTFAFAQVNTTETSTTQDQPEETIMQEDQNPAGYPGGLMKLRKDLANRIHLKGIKDSSFSKAKIIISTEGKIENIVVTGDNVEFNKRIEKAIKSLKTRWKPAVDNGILVRSYYTVPFTLTFE